LLTLSPLLPSIFTAHYFQRLYRIYPSFEIRSYLWDKELPFTKVQILFCYKINGECRWDPESKSKFKEFGFKTIVFGAKVTKRFILYLARKETLFMKVTTIHVSSIFGKRIGEIKCTVWLTFKCIFRNQMCAYFE